MEAHERQQAILQLLQQTGEVKIETLAHRFGASPNTIRNDLNLLDSHGLLRRVRGGALLPERARVPSNIFASRLDLNRHAKVNIARWAAGLVQDGDAIVLDASTTVYYLATFLQERRNLTVVTNGLEAALLLARNPSNKIILAANVVSSDGRTLIGNLPPLLQDGFCASRCFISCSGLTVPQGLTERSVDEASIKSHLIRQAQQVIALVDASKFGRVDTSRFAGLDRIHHLITDQSVTAEQLASLRQAGDFLITVVGETITETLPPRSPSAGKPRYRIGFANLSERMVFAQQVRRSLERAVAHHGKVELLIRDNQLDRQTALQNVDWFVANGVDLIIEYHIDAQVGNVIMDKLKRVGIPVIAVDIPMPGATFFGADNYRAGFMAGEALGSWIKANWQARLDILLELHARRVGASAEARLQGQREGVEAVIGPLRNDQIRCVDCPVILDEAEQTVANLLPSLPLKARIGIVAINDDAALGALAAFEKAGRLHQVVAVGQNADELGRAALRRPGFPFIGTTRYAPEQYGDQLLELALKILAGEPVAPAVYQKHVLITRANIDQYYPEFSPQVEH